jgi:signal transduction histidine kinase
MQDIQRELQMYELKRQASHRWFYALAAIVCLLLLLVCALIYIVQSRRRHLREMKKAYDKILESDQMKTAFIQNVSHEVRTPLNIISGFAQVISASEFELSSEERHHIAETMMRNTRLVTMMINEVLEMSNVDHVDTTPSTPLPANEALNKIVRDFRRELSLSDDFLRFESTLDDSFTVSIRDHVLNRIIHPLLDNAVKNTKEGVVRVCANVEKGRLVISVIDHGPGVPESEAEHIFERFVKLDSFKEGLGLGLTFSRTMVRRLGGEVWLDTTYAGPGACFKLML